MRRSTRFFLRRTLLMAISLCAVSMVETARAEVVRVEIDGRAPFADGHRFGRSGAYEKITGRIYLSIDPLDPANRPIVDLSLAPRDAQGKVAFWTEFFLLTPADPLRGNRRLLFGIPDQGDKRLLYYFNDQGGNNPTTLEDAGNGFLMNRGYAILWTGTGGNLLPGNHRLTAGFPIAQEKEKPIEGKIYTELTTDRPTFSLPLIPENSDPYPTVNRDHSSLRLSMRPSATEPAVDIPPDEWSFARWDNKAKKAIPNTKFLYLKNGFRPGWLYELTYVGRAPRIEGLALASVRDIVSFLRYQKKNAAGVPNPLSGALDRAYAFGSGRAGQFLHAFVFEGFNADQNARPVFDGMIPLSAGAGRGFFNYRFAQPARSNHQHEAARFPGDRFPFASTSQKDPVTGQKGNTLARVRESGCVPKLFFVQTATDYWNRAASLLHTDVEGKKDLATAPEVRLYFIAGTQQPISESSKPGNNQYSVNTVDYRPVLRALLVALDQWVGQGIEPPPSQYPRLDNQTLVNHETYRQTFPRISGVRVPDEYYRPRRWDFGPRVDQGILDHAPPKPGKPYQTLVPACDENGNDLGGIRLPDVAVPLSTFTGWNLRGASSGAEGQIARAVGSQFPLPGSTEEKLQSADPRVSIQERYPNRDVYLTRVTDQVLQLHTERFLLDADAVSLLDRSSKQSLLLLLQSAPVE